MKINNSNQLRFGVVLSYVQMAAAIVLQLVYTPFALRILGNQEYGLLQTTVSTVAMLSILSLGFNASYIRYYTRRKQDNDEQGIYKLNGLFLILFCILGTVVLACGLFLAGNLELVFDQGLTQQEYITGRILLIIATANLSLSFVKSVFSNIITAHEKYVFLKVVAMIESVGAPVINFAILYMGLRSIAMTVVSLVLGVIGFVLYGYYVLRVLKQKFVFRGLELGLLKDLACFTSFILINMIVDQVNNQVGKLVLARFCGTAIVTLYAVGVNFSNYYTQFSTAISGIFTPRVHQMVISTEKDPALQRKTLTGFFTKVGRIQFLLLALIMSGFVLFGQTFLQLWVGPGYEESYYVALICMIPATIPLIQNVGIEIQRAENLHHYRSYIYGIMAVFNILISIQLCQSWGAVGTAVGTGFACLVGNGLVMNIFYHKKINIDMLVFWRNILRQILGLLPAFVVGYIITQVARFRSWLHLGGGIAIYVVAYLLSAWLLAMDETEKSLVRRMVQKVVRRGA